MLLQSLDGQSDSVFIDLLTYSDLELLKSRKTGKPESSSAASKLNNKRYLIMTYAVEYDRVHYPLPLSFEEAPDPANLKMTISRLRQELADLKSSVVRP
jgi:coiled-coil domain-containing protein 61